MCNASQTTVAWVILFSENYNKILKIGRGSLEASFLSDFFARGSYYWIIALLTGTEPVLGVSSTKPKKKPLTCRQFLFFVASCIEIKIHLSTYDFVFEESEPLGSAFFSVIKGGWSFQFHGAGSFCNWFFEDSLSRLDFWRVFVNKLKKICC